MALKLDPTVARRRPSELAELVAAIQTAGSDDEQDWLEWKSELDLTTKQGAFAIARTILAMANREPARAAATAGGLGYIVVGVAPGERSGITPIDTAVLDDKISAYVGEGPAWSAHRVHGDREVLVIVVEPPQPGNPIFPLQKASPNDGRISNGTILVRSGTKTHPATAGEIRMLSERASDASTVQTKLLALEEQRDRDRRIYQARLVSVDLMTSTSDEGGDAPGEDVWLKISNAGAEPVRRVRFGVADNQGWVWGPQLVGTIGPGDATTLTFRSTRPIDDGLDAPVRFQDLHQEYWVVKARRDVEEDAWTTDQWISASANAVRTSSQEPRHRGRIHSTSGSENSLEEWQESLRDPTSVW